jgi:hypothetical protein
MTTKDFPPRLRTESNVAVKRLLDHAAHDAPSSEYVAGVVAGVVAATGSTARTALAFGKWGKLMAVIGSAGLVTIGATLALHARNHEPAPIATTVALVQPTASAAPRAVIVEARPDPAPAETLAPPVHVSTPTTPRASSTVEDSSIAIELQRMLAIRQHMLAKDTQAALDGAQAYERDYPHGAFVPEAEAMAIEALESSGRTDEAKTRADRFLAQYGNSPQATRVRALRDRMP